MTKEQYQEVTTKVHQIFEDYGLTVGDVLDLLKAMQVDIDTAIKKLNFNLKYDT